jgi:HlyD family secretion protein
MDKREYRWTALAIVLLAGCSDGGSHAYNGYIEAEPVRVSSPVGGRLLAIKADRGDRVKPGQSLFTLEQDDERAAVDEAAAQVKQSEAQAADMATGKRPDEIAASEAALRAAQASLRQSESDLKRQTALAKSGFTSGANLDAYQAKRDSDAAQVAELSAQLRVAHLASRDEARRAADAASSAARAQLAQREWVLGQKSVAAPIEARVEDRYYRVGEWVPAGSPVYSLLAPTAVKARFYVPETKLQQVPQGAKVMLSCDGCGAPMPATVGFVARDAEFTPPVIYSKDNRDKLVYLVEAWPSAADAARLRPGQPVDVSLGAGK